jgi:hypothetical protein
VENNSQKDLGSETSSGRQITTTISESSSLLSFGGIASDTHTSDLSIPINVLEAHRITNVEVSVKVSDSAIPYTKTKTRVSLHLRHPNNSEITTIQHYILPIQISNIFQFNPDAHMLLITNSETESKEVEEWHSLICEQLGLKMDIWNVGLNGHLGLLSGSETQSLFDMYCGKSIILGNMFEYFERGRRTVLDLIDHEKFFACGVDGSNFIISGLQTSERVCKLRCLLQSRSYPRTHSGGFQTGKKLVQGIVAAYNKDTLWTSKFICRPKRKGSNNSTRCQKKAKRIANGLQKWLPMVTFSISWSSSLSNKNSCGRIEVFPCLPSVAKLLATSNANELQETNRFCTLLTIPFSKRLEFLWNHVIEKKGRITEGLVEAIEYDLALELERYLAKPTWPDCIRKREMFSHLPRLQQFFSFDCLSPFPAESLGIMISILADLLLLVQGKSGRFQRAFTFATQRLHLESELLIRLKLFLKCHYDYLGGKIAQNQWKECLSQKIAGRKNEGRNSELLTNRVAKRFGIILGSEITDDVMDVESVGNIIIDEGELQQQIVEDMTLVNCQKEDFKHTQEKFQKMTMLPIYQ